MVVVLMGRLMMLVCSLHFIAIDFDSGGKEVEYWQAQIVETSMPCPRPYY